MKELLHSLLGTLTGTDPRDIRHALKRDHDELLELAEALCEGSGGSNRRQRFDRFRELLRAHSRSEERTVYRALQRTGAEEAKDFANEGEVEHGSVDALLAKLSRMRDLDSEKAHAHFQVIKEMLEHHIEEEYGEMFGLLSQHFSAEELAQLGERFESAKGSLATRHRKPLAREEATA